MQPAAILNGDPAAAQSLVSGWQELRYLSMRFIIFICMLMRSGNLTISLNRLLPDTVQKSNFLIVYAEGPFSLYPLRAHPLERADYKASCFTSDVWAVAVFKFHMALLDLKMTRTS